LNTLSLNDVKILTEPRATLTETSAPRRRLTVKNRTLTEPGQSIPSEILEEIFLRLSTQELLLSLSLVCKKWRQIIENSTFWRNKVLLENIDIPRNILQNPELEWKFYASLTLANDYEANLIQNGCGEDVEVLIIHQAIELENNSDDNDSPWPDYPHWTVLSSGGQGWTLELLGTQENNLTGLTRNACYSTSFQYCTKEQIVHLCIPGKILDMFQPDIIVSDYYNKSPGHGAVYELKVYILDGCGKVLGKPFNFRDVIDRADADRWRKVSHTFSAYGVGARFVKFYHGGMTQDMDMEEGWYGAKMTGSCVQLSYPDKLRTSDTFSCQCRRNHLRK